MSQQADQSRQPTRVSRRKKALLTVYEIAVFGMLGALMMVSDLLMNIIPNVHPVGVMIVVLTVVYRWKALFPIYVYVLLIGLMEGIGLWWLPYLYIWTLLWGMIMLLPRRMPTWLAAMIYAAVCGLHGFAFGFLWIPSQMLLMGFSFDQALVWWKFGFITADIPHGIGNLVGSTLIIPLVTLIRKLDKRAKT
jgi:energy-coupling factor transport system substrate-specific component